MSRLLTLLAMTMATIGHADDKVHIVVDKSASNLEKKAATEIAAQFERLFEVETKTTTKLPKNTPAVLIGPKAAIDNGDIKLPKLTNQGFILESFNNGDADGVIIAGGSPVATLWAAYELGHRFGIRYTLREDIYPAKVQQLNLADISVKREPLLRTRKWRTVNDFAIGPESWGIDDHRRTLRQLAKLTFNEVLIQVYSWQPFVDYEFRGVKKQTAELWYGEELRVDGDIPGKKVFGGADVFHNPHFVGKTTYKQKVAAGTGLVQAIINEAHSLGMKVNIGITPLEFPKEFAKVLPSARPSGLNQLCIQPGDKQRPDDETLRELVATQINAYLKTYPNIDGLSLTLPEIPTWHSHAEDAWKSLAKDRDLGDLTLKSLEVLAAKRNLIAPGERGRAQLRGNIVGLATLNQVLADVELGDRQLVITDVDPALYPILDQLLPKGATSQNFVDHTARRIVENRALLSHAPAKKIRNQLIMTLADDNVGVLSQSAARSIGELIADLHKYGWDGFSTRYWLLGELDPTVYLLSRASWDKSVTARSAHDDLFTTITGKQSASDRLWLGFGHIEAATNLLGKHAIGFAVPVPNMLTRHNRAEPLPDWFEQVTEHYTQAMVELYRSRGAADPRARPMLFHYAKRSEYVLEYINCVKALRESALAKENGNKDEAIEKLAAAVESIYGAIDHLSVIAKDNGERGLIALLANYGYLPLLEMLEKAEE